MYHHLHCTPRTGHRLIEFSSTHPRQTESKGHHLPTLPMDHLPQRPTSSRRPPPPSTISPDLWHRAPFHAKATSAHHVTPARLALTAVSATRPHVLPSATCARMQRASIVATSTVPAASAMCRATATPPATPRLGRAGHATDARAQAVAARAAGTSTLGAWSSAQSAPTLARPAAAMGPGSAHASWGSARHRRASWAGPVEPTHKEALSGQLTDSCGQLSCMRPCWMCRQVFTGARPVQSNSTAELS